MVLDKFLLLRLEGFFPVKCGGFVAAAFEAEVLCRLNVESGGQRKKKSSHNAEKVFNLLSTHYCLQMETD